MAIAKKKPAAKKSTVSKVKAKVSKALPKTKALPAKVSSKAAAPKVSTKATPIPAGREHQLAEQALKLVDQAASVLRGGIRGSAATSAKSRIAAKKKANELLSKASSNLSKAIEGGASTLQGILGKL